MGEHLLKKRLENKKLQADVAKTLEVSTNTYLDWEKDRRTPPIKYFPSIIKYLGTDPSYSQDRPSQEIAAKRRSLGLTIKQAAVLAGVDPDTFSKWEKEDDRGRLDAAAQRFLAYRAKEIS